MAAPKTEVPKHLNGETPPSEPEVVEPQETAQPMRVFGLSGAPVWLAGREFHFARFTTAMMRRLLDLFNEQENLPMFTTLPDATLGEMAADALVTGGDVAARQLERWLGRVLFEDVPDGLADDCMPEEVTAVVDDFFHLSGMNLLGRSLKNSLAVQAESLDARIREAMAARTAPQAAQQQTSGNEPTAPPESVPSTPESASTG